jgi:GT2 family glycosyltransferase
MSWWRRGPRIEIEEPAPGAEVGESVDVVGWAFSPASPLRSVQLRLGDSEPRPLHHESDRPDVARVHGCDPACGIRERVSLAGLADGPLALRVEVVDASGRSVARSVRVVRRAPPEAPAPASVPAAPPAPPAAPEGLVDALALFRHELGRDPSVLDASRLDLARALANRVVTPLAADTWPYLDGSFDLVVVEDGAPDRVERAARLASEAVVLVGSEGAVRVERRLVRGVRPPSFSVVIPVFGQAEVTEACLERVLATWPPRREGEVVVVDDGSEDATPQVLEQWSARDARIRVVRLPRNAGFVAACNAGAAAARGDALVFLNNDTLPSPGWLPPLLETLGLPRAGVVGGKLLYPDGVLQEAGGVIFSDGDGANFGKGDPEPDAPLFDCVREVDYCSGALLATPRRLFEELGGFDTAFAPAYYEDTDYAFRVRQRGYRVLYQPASQVVHLEGRTAGRDLSAGAKRHQVANRATFARRWATTLATQPAHPGGFDRVVWHRLARRDPRDRRVLCVFPTMPEPDRESGSRRCHHLLELLVEAGWGVSLLVENATGGERCARLLRQLGVVTYAGPATRDAGSELLPSLSTLLDCERFDLALLGFWYVAERHLPTLRAEAPRTRVLVDSIDLHFLRAVRAGFVAMKAGSSDEVVGEGEADQFRREINAYAAADGVLTVSAREAAWVDDLLGRPGHGLHVPDLEDASAPPAPREERNGLLFLGNFRHAPNRDALLFLAEVVARLDPRVLDEHPLSIVGNALDPQMLGPLAGHPRVRAVGFVPSVEPYLRRAMLSLVPLRYGAGTKRKLLQSLLAGTPCVTTSIGAEGLPVEHDKEVVVADDPAAFAAAIVRLLHAPAAWQAMSAAGAAAIARHHGRGVVRARFERVLEGLFSPTGG